MASRNEELISRAQSLGLDNSDGGLQSESFTSIASNLGMDGFNVYNNSDVEELEKRLDEYEKQSQNKSSQNSTEQDKVQQNAKAVKTAAELVATAYAGALGGSVVDAISKTRFGQNILNNAGEDINNFNNAIKHPLGIVNSNSVDNNTNEGEKIVENEYSITEKDIKKIETEEKKQERKEKTKKIAGNVFKAIWIKRHLKFIIFGGGVLLVILFIIFLIVILAPNAGAMLDLTEVNYSPEIKTVGTYTQDEIEGMLLYVGDSRTVGLKSSLNNDSIKYIAEVSMGYNWLVNTAKSQMNSLLNSEESEIKFVVIALGVNDLYNIDNYINIFNSLKTEYSNVKFYFLSVNPVDEQKARSSGYTITNNQIESFNSKLENALEEEEFINSYSKLDTISTSDGLHYLSNTYFTIHQIVVNHLIQNNSRGGNTVTCAMTYQDGYYYLTTFPQTDDCNVSRFEENELGLEPNFYNNLMSLVSDAKSALGCYISYSETFRTRAQQQYFYNCYQQKLNGNPNPCNNGNLAAVPGRSMHEYGLAADLGFSSNSCMNYMHNNASKYNLGFPVAGENWHIQVMNFTYGNPPS